jgi:4,5-dihydroxyphthalate decarboxylase
MLREQYGVDTASIAWRNGGLEAPGPGERVPLKLPPHLDVQAIGPGETLNALLAEGDLDAVISPRAPSCFGQGGAPVERLWPNSRALEERYFEETGFFPIMHCLAVRKDVAQALPWLPAALFQAFSQAKALALQELAPSNVLRVSLPWITSEAAAQVSRMGGDPWPYGFARNRAEIMAMIRYAEADGLLAEEIEPEMLFHPSTLQAPNRTV